MWFIEDSEQLSSNAVFKTVYDLLQPTFCISDDKEALNTEMHKNNITAFEYDKQFGRLFRQVMTVDDVAGTQVCSKLCLEHDKKPNSWTYNDTSGYAGRCQCLMAESDICDEFIGNQVLQDDEATSGSNVTLFIKTMEVNIIKYCKRKFIKDLKCHEWSFYFVIMLI